MGCGYHFIIIFLNFTILYWFCQISKWIHHKYTCVPHPLIIRKMQIKKQWGIWCDIGQNQFNSVAQLCPTICDPMDCSTPGFPVHHQLRPGTYSNSRLSSSDAIQPSYPLSSPSPAFSLSQHQGLFQWVSSSHQVAKAWSFSFSISPSNEYSRL